MELTEDQQKNRCNYKDYDKCYMPLLLEGHEIDKYDEKGYKRYFNRNVTIQLSKSF